MIRKIAEMEAREEEIQRLRGVNTQNRGGRGSRCRATKTTNAATYPRADRRPADGRVEDTKVVTEDLGVYKVCQFFLHEFTINEVVDDGAAFLFEEQVEKTQVIKEIEQAFCGFFESNECDLAFKDHNLDVCEAAYQLACDA